MLLLNVAMRPVLLTIGFILSLGMMWALTWMGAEIMSGAARVMLLSVDTSFFDGSNVGEKVVNTASTALNNVQMVLIGSVAILLIGGAVMVMLIHRAFDLMYESADEVMQWVGGGVKQLGGEKENAQRTTAIIAGQFGRMEGRTRGLGGRTCQNPNPEATKATKTKASKPPQATRPQAMLVRILVIRRMDRVMRGVQVSKQKIKKVISKLLT